MNVASVGMSALGRRSAENDAAYFLDVGANRRIGLPAVLIEREIDDLIV